MSTLNNSRNVEIRELRSAGLTLAEIGSLFGITRERVRQIAGDIKAARQSKKTAKKTVAYFKRVMVSWLKSAGYLRCSICKLWKRDIKYRECRDCSNARARRYYSSEEGRAKRKAWIEANKATYLEYHREYNWRRRNLNP